jgi:hypothetical protein
VEKRKVGVIMRIKNRFRDEDETDKQLLWQKKVIREEATERKGGEQVGKIKELQSLVEIQGEDGNWDHNDYMRGMYNGMELMLAIAEEREPEFRKSEDMKK